MRYVRITVEDMQKACRLRGHRPHAGSDHGAEGAGYGESAY